jgi:hypothetical protein
MTHLRGPVDSPYPMGEIEVLVPADELELATGLLLADDVESAFDDVPLMPRRHLGPWAIALALVCVAVFAYAHTLGYQR